MESPYAMFSVDVDKGHDPSNEWPAMPRFLWGFRKRGAGGWQSIIGGVLCQKNIILSESRVTRLRNSWVSGHIFLARWCKKDASTSVEQARDDEMAPSRAMNTSGSGRSWSARYSGGSPSTGKSSSILNRSLNTPPFPTVVTGQEVMGDIRPIMSR